MTTESTPTPIADVAPAPEGKDRAIHLQDSYQHAQGTLRDKYAKEFNDLRLAYLIDRGITDWAPAPTDEEKAAATIADLLRKFPALVEQLRG